MYYFLKHKKISSDLLSYKRELEAINKEINDQLNNCNKEILNFVRNKNIYDNNKIVINNSFEQLKYVINKLNSTLNLASIQTNVMRDKYKEEVGNSLNYYIKEKRGFDLKPWQDTYNKIIVQFREHQDKFREWETELRLVNPHVLQPLIIKHADIYDKDLKVFNSLNPIWNKIIDYDLNQKPILDNLDILSRELDSLEKYITI